jgi:hypothetical protein
LVQQQIFRQQLSGGEATWGLVPVDPTIGESWFSLSGSHCCGKLEILDEAEASSGGNQLDQGIVESKRRSDVGADLGYFSVPGPPDFPVVLEKVTPRGPSERYTPNDRTHPHPWYDRSSLEALL